MPRSNWSIYIEGIGETHNGSPDDANMHMLDCLKALEKDKHNTILQARFGSGRGEENWMDSTTREMHEEMWRECSPHEELVRAGVKANPEASLPGAAAKLEQSPPASKAAAPLRPRAGGAGI
jgi:hypothetical protein